VSMSFFTSGELDVCVNNNWIVSKNLFTDCDAVFTHFIVAYV
jgi:hypothetical protein